MKITQLSIFLENKKGRLYDVTSLLGKNKVNIKALTVADAKDFGVLRIIVDKPQEAAEVLKKNGFVATFTEIVAVEVSDQPGGLAQVLGIFDQEGINVEYMYGFVEKQTDKALLVFRFDNPDKAIEVLKSKKINVVGKQEIQGL